MRRLCVVSANNKNTNEQSWAFEGDKFVHSELEIEKVYFLWMGAEAKNWRENVFSGVWSKKKKNILKMAGKKKDFAIKAEMWIIAGRADYCFTYTFSEDF